MLALLAGVGGVVKADPPAGQAWAIDGSVLYSGDTSSGYQPVAVRLNWSDAHSWWIGCVGAVLGVNQYVAVEVDGTAANYRGDVVAADGTVTSSGPWVPFGSDAAGVWMVGRLLYLGVGTEHLRIDGLDFGGSWASHQILNDFLCGMAGGGLVWFTALPIGYVVRSMLTHMRSTFLR